MYEALLRLAWKGFIPWLQQKHNEDTKFLTNVSSVVEELSNNGPNSESFADLLGKDDLNQLSQFFCQYMESMNSSQLAAFWISYIEIVKNMLQLIRATREQNWSLHLASIQAVIPWCFAYDRKNYSRYLPIYYADMISLPSQRNILLFMSI